MKEIDYSKITDNPKVIELLKKRAYIERRINDIDNLALTMYQIEEEAVNIANIPDYIDAKRKLITIKSVFGIRDDIASFDTEEEQVGDE